MIITVASFKGGVGKTTTAIHLAGLLQKQAPTLLVDGDPNQSCRVWESGGPGLLPFKIVGEHQAARYSRNYEHIVIDTEAGIKEGDLDGLIEGCDLLVLPSTPDTLGIDALCRTLEVIEQKAQVIKPGQSAFKVLLTLIPRYPSTEGADARHALEENRIPLFSASVSYRSAFRQAAGKGVLVSQIKSPGAQAGWEQYQEVGREILRETVAGKAATMREAA